LLDRSGRKQKEVEHDRKMPSSVYKNIMYIVSTLELVWFTFPDRLP